MRLLAFIPILLSTAAVVLGLLCIFAGSKPGFMQGYPILSLNTSRIGQDLIKQISSSSSGSGSSSHNPLTNLIHNITSTITGAISNELSGIASSLAHAIGVQDFYSAFLLDHCEGSFVPGPVPNATLSKSAIHRNTTYCSPRSGSFNFTPGAALQHTLDMTGTGITLQQLHWPSQIDDGFRDLKVAMRATLVLYCLGVVLAFAVVVSAAVWMVGSDQRGRRGCAAGVGSIAFLSFLVLGIASGIVTAAAVKADKIIDKYGKPISVQADRGNGYLALTWVGTACMFLAGIVGCFGVRNGGRRRRAEKFG